MKIVSAASGVALFLVSCATLADVNDTPTERRLSLPLNPSGIVIPREDWVLSREQRRPDDMAVYYMLSSEKRQMFFSVFLEKTNVCRSSDSCLDAALKNPSYKEAKELRKSEEGQFRIASFFLDQPQGAPIKQAHILASAYSDGQWIDVHISKADKERPDIAPLLEFLRKVTLK